jgi:LmbE family N-acetylglucosaminyl deacetylase
MPIPGLRVIAIGAHPDDCEVKAAGTAAKMAKAGHAVKFLSVTNGDAGHHRQRGAELAGRRHVEGLESARRLGIAEYEALDNHDGELEAGVEVRRQIIRAIRQWKADLVLTPRPNDYHPDHRYTSIGVQDAAYMVLVPNIVPEVPPLRRNPIFLYYEDEFQKPVPFRPDVVVGIDDVWDAKLDSLDAHVSQFYEWLPWVHDAAGEVPVDPSARRQWLAGAVARFGRITPAVRAALERRYGAAEGQQIHHAESFELCEYGFRPNFEDLEAMFPR